MIGILLINLGTPEAPTEAAVREYLNVFLSDPYVITLPKILRDVLVQKVILPKRPKQSAHAYQQIWTDQGSPLLVNSLALQNTLQKKMGDSYCIELGMRYSKPSIEDGIHALVKKNCGKIIILPLYPQFANATTQSTLDVVNATFKKIKCGAEIKIIRDFYNQDFYIDSFANIIRDSFEKNNSEYILFSYHGLPIRQLNKKNCSKHCHLKHHCPVNHDQTTNCYRAQCYATTDLIAKKLGLTENKYQTTFQSRLGFTQWIGPYTDHALHHLREKGIKKLSVVCPSFVADCIETLEEINIRLRAQWITFGGESFELIPCLNADETWVNTLSEWICNQSGL